MFRAANTDFGERAQKTYSTKSARITTVLHGAYPG